jgi:hypothetical protein
LSWLSTGTSTVSMEVMRVGLWVWVIGFLLVEAWFADR